MSKLKAFSYPLLVSIWTLPTASYAQSVPPQPDTATPMADEITVTAQKRSERINDVPLSVTAATGLQLVKEGITSPSDLGRIVPGFTYTNSYFGAPIFTIRGIGTYDTFFATSPAVSVYVDQVPLPYLLMSEAAGLDIERVEVLKGPQGTLFGQNSTGGAVNYIAAKPTQDPHAGFDVTYGRFNEVQADGFVSGPITDTLTARVAVRHEARGDWQYSTSRPSDGNGQRDFTAVRLLLDWKPTDRIRFELNANAWWDHSDNQALQYLAFNESAGFYPEARQALGNRPPAPHNDRAADWDAGFNFGRNDRFKQISLRADIDLPANLALTSISSYSSLHVFDPADADGTNFLDVDATNVGYVDSFSQEVRVAGPITSRLQFTLGGNYQHDISRGATDLLDGGSNDGVGPFRWLAQNQTANQRVNTIAGFGALDLKLTRQLTLQGSARYTDERRRFNGCLQDAGDGKLATAIDFIHTLAGQPSDRAAPGQCVTLDSNSPVAATLRDGVNDHLNEHNVSWRTSLNWKPIDRLLLYANVTKGYKSGTFTDLPAVFSNQFQPVRQESVLAYEAGFKLDVLNRAVNVSGAGFYYKYDDKQVLGFINIFPFGNLPALQNIPRGSVRGGELEVSGRPVSQLRLTAGVTYVDSRVDGDFVTADGLGNPVDIKGEAFPYSPKWNLTGDAEYTIPVSSSWSTFLGGDVSYRSSSYAAFGENQEFKIDKYALVDLRAGIETPDGKYRLQVWGRNVFNQYYWNQVGHPVDTIVRLTGMPATYGITLSSRF